MVYRFTHLGLYKKDLNFQFSLNMEHIVNLECYTLKQVEVELINSLGWISCIHNLKLKDWVEGHNLVSQLDCNKE